MWIANLLGGIVFLFFGIVILVTKEPSLVAGYATLSPSERAKFRWDKIMKFLGRIFLLTGAELIICGVLLMMNIGGRSLLIGSWIFMFLLIILGVISINRSKSFRI